MQKEELNGNDTRHSPIWVKALMSMLYIFIVMFVLDAYQENVLKDSSSLLIIFPYTGFFSFLIIMLPSIAFYIGVSLVSDLIRLTQIKDRKTIFQKWKTYPERTRELIRIKNLKKGTILKLCAFLLFVYVIIGFINSYIEVFWDKIVYHSGFIAKSYYYPYADVVGVEIDYTSGKGSQSYYILEMDDGRKVNIGAGGIYPDLFYELEHFFDDRIERVCSRSGKEGIIDEMPQKYQAYYYEKYFTD